MIRWLLHRRTGTAVVGRMPLSRTLPRRRIHDLSMVLDAHSVAAGVVILGWVVDDARLVSYHAVGQRDEVAYHAQVWQLGTQPGARLRLLHTIPLFRTEPGTLLPAMCRIVWVQLSTGSWLFMALPTTDADSLWLTSVRFRPGPTIVSHGCVDAHGAAPPWHAARCVHCVSPSPCTAAYVAVHTGTTLAVFTVGGQRGTHAPGVASNDYAAARVYSNPSRMHLGAGAVAPASSMTLCMALDVERVLARLLRRTRLSDRYLDPFDYDARMIGPLYDCEGCEARFLWHLLWLCYPRVTDDAGDAGGGAEAVWLRAVLVTDVRPDSTKPVLLGTLPVPRKGVSLAKVAAACVQQCVRDRIAGAIVRTLPSWVVSSDSGEAHCLGNTVTCLRHPTLPRALVATASHHASSLTVND